MTASIRAYGAQEALIKELRDRLYRRVRAGRTLSNLTCWVMTRIEPLSAAFVTALAAWLVYGQGAGSSETGFTLNMSRMFEKGFSVATLLIAGFSCTQWSHVLVGIAL